MIRNETEYKEASTLLSEQRERLSAYRISLRESGVTEEAIQQSVSPTESFHLHLSEEVEGYELLQQGRPAAVANRNGLGLLLVSLRASQGLTQGELAKRLGVEESRVSRDERNEYFGITLERATRILEALNVRIFPA